MRAPAASLLGAAAVLAALLSCSACGGGASLDAFQAARIIQDHAEFRRLKTVRLEGLLSGPCSAPRDYSDMLLRFRSLGLAELREESGWRDSRRQVFCRVVLSEEARRDIDSTGWPEGAASPGAESAEIPIATPNFVRLDGISHPDAFTAEVTFRWQWQPNMLGRKLGVGPGLMPGTATLWLYDGEWRLRSLQRME